MVVNEQAPICVSYGGGGKKYSFATKLSECAEQDKQDKGKQKNMTYLFQYLVPLPSPGSILIALLIIL